MSEKPPEPTQEATLPDAVQPTPQAMQPPPPQPMQPPPQAQMFAPPPAGYQPQPPAYGQAPSTHTVVVATANQPPMLVTPAFRENPIVMVCPHCHSQITTATTYEAGTMTWVVCGILILIGLWLGCCLIPFCINGCKDVIHSCPHCRHTVGCYRRM